MKPSITTMSSNVGTISQHNYNGERISFVTFEEDMLLPIDELLRNGETNNIAEGNDVGTLSRKFVFLRTPTSDFSGTKSQLVDAYNNSIEGVSPLIPKKINGKYQIGRPVGSFEYMGQTFIVLNTAYPLTDETVPEKGVYKGVIVKPSLYFSDKVGEQVDDGVHKTGKILIQGGN